MAMKAVKFKNAIKKIVGTDEVEFAIKNDRAPDNGCTGFITHSKTGRIVYVKTDVGPYGPLQGKIMYRAAKDLADYRGDTNRWAEVKDDAFAEEIVEHLRGLRW